MAKTHGDRLEAIEHRLADLERSLDVSRTATDVQLENVKEVVKDLQGLARELQATDVRRAEADARLDQRCTALEKNADRGWQLWLAALGFGFGLISLLVTAALQLKK